ncbi:SPT3 Dosage dependent suppressor of Ty-induced promoter mutations-like protein, partial [Coemansia aciculifera]
MAGMASPLGNHPSHLHLVDGSVAGFKGGRQAMSARNSPTLRPYAHHHHHALLDTYSQFASLAGTPNLGNTPLGSPMLSAAAAAVAAAAHMNGNGGFDAPPFHLPQAAAPSSVSASLSGGGNTTGSSGGGSGGYSSSSYGNHHHYSLPNSATGLGPTSALSGPPMSASSSQQHHPGTLPLSASAAAAVAAMSSGNNLLFGNANGFAQPHQQMAAPSLITQQHAMIQVSQLLPAQGPVAGGTSVLISGRGFHSNIAVYFGSVQAGRVQVMSASNIACVLPPTKAAGPVALRIHDLNTMDVVDGSGDGQPLLFTYVEDTDHTMLELSLLATGLRQSPSSQQQQHQSIVSPNGSPVIGGGFSSAGGSPLQQNTTSVSPSSASSAVMLQDPAVVSILRQLRGASENRNLVEIESGLVNLFATLLGKGMVDESRLSMRHEGTGRSLLHFAALLGMLNLMSFLAGRSNSGVSLDDVDHNGMTAMHFASMYGRSDIVDMLLGAGASYKVRSAMGMTAGE